MSHLNDLRIYQYLANSIRVLAADAVEKAQSGHPGMPLGMADVMTVLAKDFLNFNPKDPKWFNRDRLILSAGHGSMLLYSFLYLAGYNDIELDDITSFRELGSICAGHPEYGAHPAIETTTGPLGQGVANAIGMAIAGKKYQQKLGSGLVDYKIYCIVGDGCLMEGISYEALSLAGHLNLDNLIIIFDDNGITIDGASDISVSEDHLQKFAAMGFYCQSFDGHDVEGIKTAFKNANNASKPSFIAFKTEIGRGAKNKAGSEKSHGAPLGNEEISFLKENFDMPEKPFEIPAQYLNSWREIGEKCSKKYAKWRADFDSLSTEIKKYISLDYKLMLNSDMVFSGDQATRSSSGQVIKQLLIENDKLVCGSADLAGSNNILNENCKVINRDDFSGNFINFGVREHAMAAICNGLELSGFRTICGTFFVFSDYMRPAIRLSAIMGLRSIYVMTHDSIGVGEDGPTHQPIEHLAALRAMPNIEIYRPAYGAETLAAYKEIITGSMPAILVLSRQKLLQLEGRVDSIDISKGAYIIEEAQNSDKLDYVIFASGSEVQLALQVSDKLKKNTKSVRVVSVVCFDRIYNDLKFIRELTHNAKHKIAIEAGSDFGWHKIIGSDGLFFGMKSFGESAPAEKLFEHFGLTADKIMEKLND